MDGNRKEEEERQGIERVSNMRGCGGGETVKRESLQQSKSPTEREWSKREARGQSGNESDPRSRS